MPGSCVMVTLEGTRPMLMEIQALVDTGGPSPRRLSVGLDKDRLAGEVRPARRGQERLKEAAKLGFTVAVVPKANVPKKPEAQRL